LDRRDMFGKRPAAGSSRHGLVTYTVVAAVLRRTQVAILTTGKRDRFGKRPAAGCSRRRLVAYTVTVAVFAVVVYCDTGCYTMGRRDRFGKRPAAGRSHRSERGISPGNNI